MKNLLFGIAGVAIACLCTHPAYADGIVYGGGYSNGGTRVIVQFGNGGQYSSYDPNPYYQPQYRDRYHQSQYRDRYVVPNVVPYVQPNFVPNPYNLPTSSNPYNLPHVNTVLPYSPPVYIYQNNPYHRRHHHRYYNY